MNSHQHRLQAFTIMEMMVALVLTALAVALVYAGLRFVQRQGEQFSRQLGDFGEVNRLHSAIQTDAGAAGELRREESGLAFYRKDKLIQYSIMDSICVRYDGTVADTFHVQVDSLGGWFLGRRQESIGGVLDHATLYAAPGNRHLSIVVRKQYDAATLIHLTDSEP
ncbi:PulJ/GspJ family protein [Parapedobacter sp. DT-150]|uniref:PulJ/GspJ family protein n=1 Tax=Parapedobacter sp. DT-150 TaxID=3396162 RepID=UPI003F1BE674